MTSHFTNTMIRATAAAGLLVVLPSCARVAVEPIEVKPIHITMDVNIRVQKQLDQFFAFEQDQDLLRDPSGAGAKSQPTGAGAAPSVGNAAGKPAG